MEIKNEFINYFKMKSENIKISGIQPKLNFQFRVLEKENKGMELGTGA